MCTAITYKTDRLFFGRTLDYTQSFGENVIICPRNFIVPFKFCKEICEHPAIIGIGTVRDNFPLYYDAMNESGLCVAALNFVESAVYRKPLEGALNLAHFEIILYFLSNCKSVSEVEKLLPSLNITDDAFSSVLPAARLHWLIADSEKSIVLESTKKGVLWYDNPYGIMTNEPPFDEQLKIVKTESADGFSDSSSARFIRAHKSVVLANYNDGIEGVSRFFHILSRVSRIGSGENERTIYTSCADTKSGIYYYTTYENRAITATSLWREGIADQSLTVYPLSHKENIIRQN